MPDTLSREKLQLYRDGLRHAPTVAGLAVDDTSLLSITNAEWADRCRALLAHMDALTDPENLSAAMNEAYGYRDRDNAEPVLPFFDDIEAFWDPFAAKVSAILRGEQ